MKLAYLVIAALVTLACSDLPTRVSIEGIYNLVSIDGESLPVNETAAGELRVGFNNTFEIELCGSSGACTTIFEGIYSWSGNRLLFRGADAVSEATVQGTRLTIDVDGATYDFRQYTPDN